MDAKPRIGIITGSIRRGRLGARVAHWFHGVAAAHPSIEPHPLDLLDWPLPLYAHERATAAMERDFPDPLERRWVETIAGLDGYVLITPEYNHGYPPSLKNALDYAYVAWNAKPVAFVSYGGASGGIRAVQQLRQVVVELQMVPLRHEVNIPFVGSAMDEQGHPKDPAVARKAGTLLDALAWWATSLAEARERRPYPGKK